MFGGASRRRCAAPSKFDKTKNAIALNLVALFLVSGSSAHCHSRLAQLISQPEVLGMLRP